MRTALQVRQIFCDTELDTRHFTDGAVEIGNRTAWRWRFLGVDMGTVPAALRHVLPWLAPVWSECEPVAATHFPVADDEDQRTLFSHGEDGWTVDVPPGWTVDTEAGTTESPVLAGPITLRRGDVAFRARVVPAPEAAPRTAPEPDLPLIGTLGSLAAAALLFSIGAHLAPAPPSATVFALEDRVLHLQVQSPPPPRPEAVDPSSERPKVADASGPPREHLHAGTTREERDRAVATSAGILSVLGNDDWSGQGLGNVAGLVDGLRAPGGSSGPQGGRGGCVGRACGFADGLSAESGALSFDVSGTQHGYGPGGFVAKGTGAPLVLESDPVVIGAVDPSEVDRVIKDHLSQIRYCYQRLLPQKPDLAGKVVVKFTIAKDGAVSTASVREDTLSDPRVAQCVASRIQRMRFVSPRGGGIAIVSYPFMFSPG